jgi:hypothetical protein
MKTKKFDLKLELKKMSEQLTKIMEGIKKRLKKFKPKENYRSDE